MKNFLLLFISGIFLISCKPKTATDDTSDVPAGKGDYTAYEAEIMKIHDAVMPKMTELNRVESQLRDIRKKASQSDVGSSAIPEGIDNMLQSVKEAQNGMLDWMENYSATKANLQQDDLMKFMENELQKITTVEEKMENSLSQAKAWIAAHPGLE